MEEMEQGLRRLLNIGSSSSAGASANPLLDPPDVRQGLVDIFFC
jgi:hypothetical protein